MKRVNTEIVAIQQKIPVTKKNSVTNSNDDDLVVSNLETPQLDENYSW